MGRYLMCAVVSRIKIRKKYKDEFDIIKNKEKIDKEVNNLVDFTKYECDVNEEVITYKIKKDFFEENVHEMIKHLSETLISFKYNFERNEEVKIDSEDFNQEKFPIIIGERKKLFPEVHNDSDAYVAKSLKNNSLLFNAEYTPIISKNYFVEERNIREEIDASVTLTYVWVGIDKISIEDEFPLLWTLNHYFQKDTSNPLSRVMIFTITW